MVEYICSLETILYYVVLAHLRVVVDYTMLTRDYTTPCLLVLSHLRVVDGAAPAVLADVAAVGSVAVVLLETLG